MESKSRSVCLVFSLWGVSVNTYSQAQPPGPQLSGSGMGPKNMHFSNSGDSGVCVPKSRLEKAKHRGCLFVGFYLLFLSFHKNVSTDSQSWWCCPTPRACQSLSAYSYLLDLHLWESPGF